MTDKELVPVKLEDESAFAIPDPREHIGIDKTDPALSEDIDLEYVYPVDPAPPGKKWVLVDDDGTGPIGYQVNERQSDEAQTAT